ncbi:hypothetical protein AHAS_Ahas17G0318400 [Arachis hypogaea]
MTWEQAPDYMLIAALSLKLKKSCSAFVEIKYHKSKGKGARCTAFHIMLPQLLVYTQEIWSLRFGMHRLPSATKQLTINSLKVNNLVNKVISNIVTLLSQ